MNGLSPRSAITMSRNFAAAGIPDPRAVRRPMCLIACGCCTFIHRKYPPVAGRGLSGSIPAQGHLSTFGGQQRRYSRYGVRCRARRRLPEIVDSRLRGNDGRGRSGLAVRTIIPAVAGMTSVPQPPPCRWHHSRFRGNDITGVSAVIPAKPVLAKAGSGNPRTVHWTPGIAKVQVKR